jgi:hypothetical protein
MLVLEHIIVTVGVVAATVSVIATLYSIWEAGKKQESAEITVKTHGKVESYKLTPVQAARFKAVLERRRLHRTESQQHAPPPPKHAAV